jgi:hypothetical protein
VARADSGPAGVEAGDLGPALRQRIVKPDRRLAASVGFFASADYPNFKLPLFVRFQSEPEGRTFGPQRSGRRLKNDPGEPADPVATAVQEGHDIAGYPVVRVRSLVSTFEAPNFEEIREIDAEHEIERDLNPEASIVFDGELVKQRGACDHPVSLDLNRVPLAVRSPLLGTRGRDCLD